MVLAVVFLGAFVMSYFHARGHLHAIEHYLEQNRPDVVLAIEAYRVENGHYPDSITNAIPHYYSGKQERLYFLDAYHYKNLGTNYYLKHFSSNETSSLDVGKMFWLYSGECSPGTTGLVR